MALHCNALTIDQLEIVGKKGEREVRQLGRQLDS